MSDEFKVLTEVEKTHLRPEELVGTIEVVEKKFNILNEETGDFEEKTFNFSEGFFRLFEEAITNSIDEYERHQTLNKIKVDIDKTYISIIDNGNGYPTHEYSFNGETKFAPEWILTKLNSGTNFSDENRKTVGMNGVGISLVNFFSNNFLIDTKNEGNYRYQQKFSNHSRKFSKPSFLGGKNNNHFTLIKFEPDFTLFKLDESILEYYLPIYKEYIRILSMIYPNIKFYLNGERIIYNVKKFIKGILNEEIIVNISNGNYNIAFGFSKNSQKNVFMINSKPIESYIGFNIFKNNIFTEIRERINRKYRLKINRNTWLNENISMIGLFKGTNVKFKNQTKDILVSYESDNKFDVKEMEIKQFVNAFLRSNKLVEDYLDFYSVKNKELASTKIVKIKNEFINKLVEATSNDIEEKILIVTEGDSAKGSFLKVRNPKIHSLLPLRGKPKNIMNESLSVILKNEKYKDLISALHLGDKDNLRHGKLYIATDQDPDGLHIRILLIYFFAKFFPWFIEQGRLFVLETPLYEYEENKKIKYSIEQPPKTAKVLNYFKGLGSLDSSVVKYAIENPILIPINDIKSIEEFYADKYEKI